MRRSIGLALGVLAVLALVVAVVGSGWSYAVLASPSMEPWASPGDLLLHRHVPPDQVEVGDVITVVGPDGRLVTHRVVLLTGTGDSRVARLQGDRSRLPDPVPVDLRDEVARVEAAVPRLGDALMLGPVVWVGTALLATGAGALLLGRRRRDATAPLDGEAPDTQQSSTPAASVAPDPRIEALLATCEQLDDDGIDPVVLRDVVRIRAATIAGLPRAERAGAVLDLDDGARFYVLACTDVDLDALALVPSTSRRRQDATTALDLWWDAIRGHLPPAAAAAIAPWVHTGD